MQTLNLLFHNIFPITRCSVVIINQPLKNDANSALNDDSNACVLLSTVPLPVAGAADGGGGGGGDPFDDVAVVDPVDAGGTGGAATPPEVLLLPGAVTTLGFMFASKLVSTVFTFGIGPTFAAATLLDVPVVSCATPGIGCALNGSAGFAQFACCIKVATYSAIGLFWSQMITSLDTTVCIHSQTSVAHD